MMIADAQIHIWAKGTPSALHRQEPYSKDQALAGMDVACVDRAVIHPPMWDPASNELAVDAVRAHPDRFVSGDQLLLDRGNRTPTNGIRGSASITVPRYPFCSERQD